MMPVQIPARLLQPDFDGWLSAPKETYCPHCRDVHDCVITVIHGCVRASCDVWGEGFTPEVEAID